MSASDRETPPGPSSDKTPLSSSGVVVKRGEEHDPGPPPSSSPVARRDSYSAYRLTPYQARLDVEMDDTAVSKVRDPSVSLILEPSAVIRSPQKPPNGRLEAVASIAVGAALGALLVVVIVLIARAL
ncbi:MAG TPA: hypothetical protein VH062_11205 [Polyangiaceae bacterium]|nr:hypothetical protein [Polyangiaceae bacterium]